jgi:hypothetical protein
MRAHVSASRPVATDPWPAIEQFLREPTHWAPLPATRLSDGRTLTTVHLGPLLHRVALTVGEPWSLPDAVSRPLAWQPCDANGVPTHERMLPGFDGRLTLRHEADVIHMVLEGTYVPPGGALGAAADRLVLHRSGEATARTLVEDIVTRLLTASIRPPDPV